jgi:trk system potassium uptake protein TrkH
MQFQAMQRILGLLLMIFSTTLLPPIVVSAWYDDGKIIPFVDGFTLVPATGFVAWWPVRNRRRELRLRDGFLVVVLFWLVLGLVGAVPFLFSTQPVMNLTDSVFESMSGLTTTGTTVITGFDTLPKSR